MPSTATQTGHKLGTAAHTRVPATQEAEVAGSLEYRSWRLAWEPQQDPISYETKSNKTTNE